MQALLNYDCFNSWPVLQKKYYVPTAKRNPIQDIAIFRLFY